MSYPSRNRPTSSDNLVITSCVLSVIIALVYSSRLFFHYYSSTVAYSQVPETVPGSLLWFGLAQSIMFTIGGLGAAKRQQWALMLLIVAAASAMITTVVYEIQRWQSFNLLNASYHVADEAFGFIWWIFMGGMVAVDLVQVVFCLFLVVQISSVARARR
jgi:hypothetical protein